MNAKYIWFLLVSMKIYYYSSVSLPPHTHLPSPMVIDANIPLWIWYDIIISVFL